MSLPLVSIGIPVYNREKLVQRAIVSAQAQTYPNLEIIVVDNCSTDRTYEIAQDYAQQDDRIKCFRNEQNLGPVPNWLRCIELSQGDYFKILFSDDWLEPRAIDTFIQPFQSHPDLAFTCSSALVHLGNDIPRLQYQRLPGGLIPTADILWDYADGFWEILTQDQVPLTPCAALFRRADALAAFTSTLPTRSEFDCNRYGIGNDVTLYWKLCQRYSHAYYISDPLVHFSDGQEGEAVSFTMSLCRSGQAAKLAHCYQSAFGHFLATASLSSHLKRLLTTRILLHHLPYLHPYWIKEAIVKSAPFFPENYPWWQQLHFSDPKLRPFWQPILRSSMEKVMAKF